MRIALLFGLALVLAGCAVQGVPPPTPTVEEQHNACAARMYSARIRGAVHWHIYEHCIKENS